MNRGSEHVCTRQGCAPRLMRPESHVYVCNQGAVHVCSSATVCQLWQWDTQHGTCPISGIQYGGEATSDYARNDPRTWPTAAAPSPRKGLGILAVNEAERIRDRASAMVKQLLYSNARVECNRLELTHNIARGREVQAAYDANQAAHGQPSYWTDRYRIMGRWGTLPLPFTIYVFDQVLHDYYVNIIVDVWAKVDRYYAVDTPPLRADIDSISVAVLYYLRNGLRCQNARLLPKDDFILLNLPHVNQLHHFSIAKSSITQGEKIIERTFEAAIARHVPEHELALAPERVAVAVAPPTEEVSAKTDEDEDEDHILLDSNGERLFPLSRNKKRRT